MHGSKHHQAAPSTYLESTVELDSMNNLAEVLQQQGKYGEAEEMHRQTWTLMKTMLGEEHPLTLYSMNNLAGVLEEQAKYKEAEEIIK